MYTDPLVTPVGGANKNFARVSLAGASSEYVLPELVGNSKYRIRIQHIPTGAKKTGVRSSISMSRLETSGVESEQAIVSLSLVRPKTPLITSDTELSDLMVALCQFFTNDAAKVTKFINQEP